MTPWLGVFTSFAENVHTHINVLYSTYRVRGECKIYSTRSRTTLSLISHNIRIGIVGFTYYVEKLVMKLTGKVINN